MLALGISPKITGVLIFYFLMALIAIGSTLYVSWHLEGSAAAINEAGKERRFKFNYNEVVDDGICQATYRRAAARDRKRD